MNDISFLITVLYGFLICHSPFPPLSLRMTDCLLTQVVKLNSKGAPNLG